MLKRLFRRMRPTGNVARGDKDRDRLRRWSVQPRGWKVARGYENGVLVEDGGRTLYLAGQIAWDADQQLVGEGNFSRSSSRPWTMSSRWSARRAGSRRRSSA